MQQIKSQQALTEKIASCTKCLEDKLSGNNKKTFCFGLRRNGMSCQ